MYDRLDKKFFGVIQKYEFDLKVSRTRTFVREQRRTKVRPCGHTLTRVKKEGNHINVETARLKGCGNSMALLIE